MTNETKNNFDKKVQMHLACSKDNEFHRKQSASFSTMDLPTQLIPVYL